MHGLVWCRSLLEMQQQSRAFSSMYGTECLLFKYAARSPEIHISASSLQFQFYVREPERVALLSAWWILISSCVSAQKSQSTDGMQTLLVKSTGWTIFGGPRHSWTSPINLQYFPGGLTCSYETGPVPVWLNASHGLISALRWAARSAIPPLWEQASWCGLRVGAHDQAFPQSQ